MNAFQKFLAGLNPLQVAQAKKFLAWQIAANRQFSPGVALPEAQLLARLQAWAHGQTSRPQVQTWPFVPFLPQTPLAQGSPVPENPLIAADMQKYIEQKNIREAAESLEGEDDGPEFQPGPKNKTFTRSNPTYNKQRNTLGGTANAAPGGVTVPVAWYMADEEDATVFTITAFVSEIVGTNIGDQVRPFLKITWATRTSPPAQVLVDISAGTQLSLCGAACWVEVGAESGTAASNEPVSITAMIGFNTTQRQSPSQRTAYITSLGAGQTVNFPVPAFAATVLEVQRDVLAAPVTLAFKDANSNVAFRTLLAANTFSNYPIQLSNDVASVDVVNGGAGTIQGRLVFGLAL